MAKQSIYTEEVIQEMIKDYVAQTTDEARAEAVERWAEKLAVSPASVRTKLALEKVYVAKARTAKNGEPIETKAAIVAQIAKQLGVDEERIESLEKATKPVLKLIREALDREHEQHEAA